MELSRIEMEAEEIGLTFEMRKLLSAAIRSGSVWPILKPKRRRSRDWNTCICSSNPCSCAGSCRRILGNSSDLDRRQRRKLIALVVKRHMIHHKAKLMQETLKLLHYWHLVHQPFVIIMFLVLLIHVCVAIRMGYTWNF